MKPAISRIVKTVAGVMAGGVVVGLVEGLGMALFPVPAEVGQNPENLSQVPFGAKLFVVLAWGLGSFAGGGVVSMLRGQRALARAVGTVMLALVLTMLMAITHPAWMAISGLLLPLPAALAGGRLFRRQEPANAPLDRS